MSLVRSRNSLPALQLGREGDGKLVLVSYHIRAGQREMLRQLSDDTGESQATVLRAILDEWSDMKLRQAAGQGQQ